MKTLERTVQNYQQMSLLEVPHVKETAKQGKVKDRKIHAQDLSQSSSELSKNLNLNLSYGRMFMGASNQDSLEKPSPNSTDSTQPTRSRAELL